MEFPSVHWTKRFRRLINLGMKPNEAKRAVEAVVADDRSAADSLELMIRKSLAVLLGEK